MYMLSSLFLSDQLKFEYAMRHSITEITRTEFFPLGYKICLHLENDGKPNLASQKHRTQVVQKVMKLSENLSMKSSFRMTKT